MICAAILLTVMPELLRDFIARRDELGELAARPSGYDRFKQRPDQYKYVYAESQFKIWLAGRASADKHPC